MAVALRMCRRFVCIALFVAACGPTVAVGDDSGSSGEPDPTTQPSPATTADTTLATTAVETSDTGDGEGACAQFGSCSLCQDGFLLDFYAPGGLEARALLPLPGGQFLAVGTPDAPGSIAWLDADGSITAQAGPYAEGLVLQSATVGPQERIILAGHIGQRLWIGVTTSAGELLFEGDPNEVFEGHLPDIQVAQHEHRGIFITSHRGMHPPTATAFGVTQFNHDVEYRGGILSNVYPPMPIDAWTRGASTLTTTALLVAVTRTEDGLRLVHRDTSVPWNIAEWETHVVELPGLPASITALHGDTVVTASNDDNAHLARVDEGDHVAWHRSLAGVRTERVGFDAMHDLVFVAGSDLDDANALWIAALDEDGHDVWAWTAPPAPERPSTPVLDVVALPDGGVAVSTSGSLWYATVRPYAC